MQDEGKYWLCIFKNFFSNKQHKLLTQRYETINYRGAFMYKKGFYDFQSFMFTNLFLCFSFRFSYLHAEKSKVVVAPFSKFIR